MTRRHFITASGAICASASLPAQVPQPSGVPLEQQPLGYDFGALEPYLDGETLSIHYGEYHANHVAKLRKALASVRVEAASVSSLLRTIDYLTPRGHRNVLCLGGKDEELTEAVKRSIRENGGAHMNHTLFWRYMAPPDSVRSRPEGGLARAIEASYGNLEGLKDTLLQAAANHMGPGWAWLVFRPDAGLFVSTTSDEDNPLMKGVVPDSEHGRPILCVDLWEHAYGLKYKGKKEDYIDAWWHVVNWPRVERSFEIVSSAVV